MVFKHFIDESVSIRKPITFLGKYISRSVSRRLNNRHVSLTEEAKWIKNEIVTLGPAYIKMGQLVASRSDIFDEVYTNELISLQDDVPPIDYVYIDDVLRTEFDNVHMKIFEHIDETPIACASIGQLHLATLHYNKNKVALKVQKPGVELSFEKDFKLMLSILEFFNFLYPNSRNINDLYDMIKQCSISILSELDYRNEKQNMDIMRNVFQDDTVYVPRVYDALTTQKVLVMEYVECQPLKALRGSNVSNVLMKSMLVKAVNNGYLHGDMHKGNFGIIVNRYDYTFVMFDCGLILDVDKQIITQLIYAISINSIDTFVAILIKYDVIVIKRNFEKSIKEIEQLVSFVSDYINDLDINRLIDKIKNNLNLEQTDYTLNPKYFLISRTLTLLEGTCKGMNDNFSYRDVVMKSLVELNITPDMLLGKISFDFEQMNNQRPKYPTEPPAHNEPNIPIVLNLVTLLLLFFELLG